MSLETKQIILEHLYEGHYCKNCKNRHDCQLNPAQAVCEKWEEDNLLSQMFGLIRNVYPNTIKGNIVSAFPMEAASDNIFYLKPIYNQNIVTPTPEKEPTTSLSVKEDEDKPVADILSKWKEMVDGVSDDKKDTLAQLLENQEAYLNSMGNK